LRGGRIAKIAASANRKLQINARREIELRSVRCVEGIRSMSELASKTCVPCRGGVPPLAGEELTRISREVPQWRVVEGHHITRAFMFSNFRDALTFVNKVGELAEEQGHHPDIFLTWGKAEITTWTHKINGLTESDFILAAKIDRL